MVKKIGFMDRIFGRVQLAELPKETGVPLHPMHRANMGSKGTQSFAGYNFEEYLQKLRGKTRADTFDQMRRSDSQIKMCLSAVKNPIKQAQWEVAETEQEVADKTVHKDFINHLLFKDVDFSFKQFVEEALTVCDFGHSVFEVTHKVVFDHPQFGTYNAIKGLGFRSQRTIERWNLDKETGDLKSISQLSNGDLDKNVDIPADFLLVLSLEREGANYEGISLLRAAYGPWFRKNTYLKLNAIGIEKFAVPTPIAKIPSGKGGTPEFDALIEALENYTQHETNYLTLPEGWEVDLHSNTYDPQKVEISIDNEDKRIAKAFLANFLELGMNGSGSYALSNDLSDFFLAALVHIAEKVCEVVNQKLIPDLIKMKYGPQPAYPQLKVSGISDKVGKEFAEILKMLGDGKWLKPADADEDFVRRRFGMPLRSEEGLRDPAPPAGGLFSEPKTLKQRIMMAHKKVSNENA